MISIQWSLAFGNNLDAEGDVVVGHLIN
jgi:hypothetical protein